MSKYTWSGGIEESIIDFKVVACRGNLTEPPNGLVFDRQAGSLSGINASERFMVILKISGQWIASLHAHEVVKRAWDK